MTVATGKLLRRLRGADALETRGSVEEESLREQRAGEAPVGCMYLNENGLQSYQPAAGLGNPGEFEPCEPGNMTAAD